MSKRFSPSRPVSRAATLAVLLAAALPLAGCAGLGDSVASGAFVDPAKYTLYDCQQLEGERKSLEARTVELQRLIDKAQTGTGGVVVAELAYRNDFISVRASAKLAEETWQRDKCVATPPKPGAVPVAAPEPPVGRRKGARL
ncbi:MAG: twin-arginine translocation pathway signal [Tardiphaga sp.]